ncbi:transposase [Streptomyces sp. DW26H14]|uniref:transposase n=1 Tax=Streptomyces sp. DW26H14 TaxID=3435395 RepID=UPI00403DC890
MVDAIAWTFRTGAQWVRLPQRYGNWRDVCNRLRMWSAAGTWERVFTALPALHLAAGQAGDAPAFADVMARVRVP